VAYRIATPQLASGEEGYTKLQVKRVPEIRKSYLPLRHSYLRCNNFDGNTEAPCRPPERGNGKGASVTIDVKATVLTALIGGPSVIATLLFAAPAMAEPATADPVAPIPVVPIAAPPPGPAPDGTVQAAAGTLPTPPDGVQHLSSPENLPPGTTDAPDPEEGKGSYLRDLWHAYQTQEISGRDALLLLSQRPMDPSGAPPAGMPANPTPPLAPGTAPAPAPAPEPEPAPPPPLFPWMAPPPPSAP
jgi:hypothetical protein